MQPDRASRTAYAVALFRALLDDPRTPGQPQDPLALDLLGPRTRACAVRLRPLLADGAVLGAVFAGLPTHVILRTTAIDNALARALRDGCKQLVILGAGHDHRAVRLDLSVPVWEVDHPSTQAAKRARLPTSPARYVPVDFATDDLDDALTRAGHDPEIPTAWIWEGVTPYLPTAATRATLAVIRRRSAPGSIALITYATPDMISMPRWTHVFGRRAFVHLGESLDGLIPTADFHALLTEAGLTVQDDTGSDDWAAAVGVRPAWLRIRERLVIAARP